MTTLQSAAIVTLLEHLFTADETAWDAGSPASEYWATLTAQERQQMMTDKTRYREFYSQMKAIPLAVSRHTGQLLYMLARSSKAQHIVEFGTSFGVSTIHLAAALRDNGGGRLISSEFEPAKIARARAHLAEAALDDLVEIREGDALQTLNCDLPESIDMLLLDGAKSFYIDILQRVENRLRTGAIIIADDASNSPAYINYVRSASDRYLSLPLMEDLEITVRIK